MHQLVVLGTQPALRSYAVSLAETLAARVKQVPFDDSTASADNIGELVHQHRATLLLATAPTLSSLYESVWVRALWQAPCPILFLPATYTMGPPPARCCVLSDGEPLRPGWAAAAARSLFQHWQLQSTLLMIGATEFEMRHSRQAVLTQWASLVPNPYVAVEALVAEPFSALHDVENWLAHQPPHIVVCVARRLNLPHVSWTRRALLLFLAQAAGPVLVVPE
ncbi:hypothetical protein [Hymenobacter canadensis]|uniref:Uncharacterized protein n=1 Tax=Hymenobacter canadensis TaxID=2999067 RepID=A0ABY7LU33_9BACT|nr:hypothetical protein [Hymenobacter canadensis]WBA43911.1 hypothetical protein O3303_20300 [Hymenobacter canadensis]